jgi:septal ring factor EnvC (AmiA/AmiB activator)
MRQPTWRWAFAILLAACCGVFHTARADDTDLDKKLLEELDDLDDGVLGEDAAPKEKTLAGTAEDSNTIDDDLLRDLDDDLGGAAGEDVRLPRDGDAQADQLGEDADPLTRIGHKMRLAETLVPERDELDRAKKLQDEIAADLAALIEEIKKQQQQQQSSSSSQNQKNKPQQGSRSKVKPGQQPKPQQKPGDRESKKPATDSQERQGKAKPTKADLAKLNEDLFKAIWGHLPEKERERLRQLPAEEIMTEYELQIEKYFRRLTEERDELP